MPKVTGGAFDALLETFASDEDKATFQSLAERNPEIKNFGLRQSDYSRKQDELKAKVELADQWEKWQKDNWVWNDPNDPDKGGATVQAIAARKEAARLAEERAQLEAKLELGDGMTFDELEKWGSEYSKKNGFVTDAAIKEKEQALVDFVNAKTAVMAKAALEVPWLNQQHKDEFGATFNPNEFLKEAIEAKENDLPKFYERWVSTKRHERYESEHKATIERLQKESDDKIAAATKEAEAKAAQRAAMGAGGQIPVDMDGSGGNMGPLQRRMLQAEPVPEGAKAPEVPLGEGGIAAFAAREYYNKSVGRT